MDEMILTYVLESEYLTRGEALALAEERDAQAASEFEASVPDSERLLSPDKLIDKLIAGWESLKQWG